MPRRIVAKTVLDEVYQGGRHSERILLSLVKNNCLPESEVSNSRNSGSTEILLVVQKAKITKMCKKTESSEIGMLVKVQKVVFSRINFSHDLLCPSFSRSNRKKTPKLSNFDKSFNIAAHTLRVSRSPQTS